MTLRSILLWRKKRSVALDALFEIISVSLYTVYMDVDHVWWLLGLVDPVSLTGYPGRPLHNILKVVLDAYAYGCWFPAFCRRQRSVVFRAMILGSSISPVPISADIGALKYERSKWIKLLQLVTTSLPTYVDNPAVIPKNHRKLKRYYVAVLLLNESEATLQIVDYYILDGLIINTFTEEVEIFW